MLEEFAIVVNHIAVAALAGDQDAAGWLIGFYGEMITLDFLDDENKAVYMSAIEHLMPIAGFTLQ